MNDVIICVLLIVGRRRFFVGLCWTLLDALFLSVGLLDSEIQRVGRCFFVCPTKPKIKNAYKSAI